jgi:hypothetical protein
MSRYCLKNFRILVSHFIQVNSRMKIVQKPARKTITTLIISPPK